ncbi:23034_t:CDS:1, partial [Dentiscutata erythropus]
LSDSSQTYDTSLSIVNTSSPKRKRHRITKTIALRSFVHFFKKENKTAQCKVCIANSKEPYKYITHSSTTNLRNHLEEHEIYKHNYKNFLDENNE